jgi:hypothetical protein
MVDPVAAGLAETIRALRTELTEAMETAAGEPLRFEVGAVQLDVTLAITKGGGVDGGVKFGVISFSAKGELTNATTHRLSLTLQPTVIDSEGNPQPVKISRKSDHEPG